MLYKDRQGVPFSRILNVCTFGDLTYIVYHMNLTIAHALCPSWEVIWGEILMVLPAVRFEFDFQLNRKRDFLVWILSCVKKNKGSFHKPHVMK